MIRHRRRWFGRKARARAARVGLLVALALLGAASGSAIQQRTAPRLAFAPTMTAYAAVPSVESVEASLTAQVTKDLPLLEDLWGMGGGSGARVHYAEAPKVVKAGEPLRVSVHGVWPDGHPFAGALVELTWKLGEARYRDVAYTDARGNVEMARVLDSECEGKACVVAVRMRKDGLQALAYTVFTPR